MEVCKITIFDHFKSFESKISPSAEGFLLNDKQKRTILKNFSNLGYDITFKMATNFKYMNGGVENNYF